MLVEGETRGVPITTKARPVTHLLVSERVVPLCSTKAMVPLFTVDRERERRDADDCRHERAFRDDSRVHAPEPSEREASLDVRRAETCAAGDGAGSHGRGEPILVEGGDLVCGKALRLKHAEASDLAVGGSSACRGVEKILHITLSHELRSGVRWQLHGRPQRRSE